MTPSVNYTIGIGIVEEAGYRMGEGGGGGGLDTSFAFQG